MGSFIRKRIAQRVLVRDEEAELETVLKRSSYMLAAQTGAVGVLFLGPSRHFLRPESPPDAFWLALTVGPYEMWDFLFPAACIFMVLAATTKQKIAEAHWFSGAVWLAFGIVWSIGGVLTAPNYLFAAGLLAIFVSAQHFTTLNLWKVEGVKM